VNLTVRDRVGLGILFVVGLSGLTAGLAYWGLTGASARVEHLVTGPSAERNLTALIRTEVSEARRLALGYARFRDKDRADRVKKMVEEAVKHAAELGKVVDEGARSKAKEIGDRIGTWNAEFARYVRLVGERGSAGDKSSGKKGEGIVGKLKEALDRLDDALENFQDDSVHVAFTEARIHAQIAMQKIQRVDHDSEKPDEADHDHEQDRVRDTDADFEEHLEWGKKFVDRLGAVRDLKPETRDKLLADWKTYVESLLAIMRIDERMVASEAALTTIGRDLGKLVDAVTDDSLALLDKSRDDIIANNASTRSWVLLGSALNVVLAIAFGWATIVTLNRRLRAIATGIDDGARDFSEAAASVATTSTRLADRAAQQASQLEETSASIEELTSTTKQNADNAAQASSLAQKARRAAEQSNAGMGELSAAMREIQESASRIAKIIEVIKEIAFQTNLLALNAAVEAARAGEHGRGFAVVAEEVRNLAGKAAAQAKETSQLIGASVAIAENGGRIVDGVVQGQKMIVDDVQSVARLMEEIAAASREQAEGVHQINRAIVTIDKLTQENSGAAETTAAASEELAGQAASVTSLVAGLVELVQGRANAGVVTVSPHHARPVARARVLSATTEPAQPRRARVERAIVETTERDPSRLVPSSDGDVPKLTEEELKDF
jgi:methyl-accepting chemotaxis protein